tara:strand:+ start:483 stop:728 length:246 start_codon:yes stop_codon:yes gene_type:complete
MNICEIHSLLAYLASIYIISSIYYLLVTRQLGTPFADALEKYPELKKIKDQSADDRANAFYKGLVLACGVMCIFKPFGNCY